MSTNAQSARDWLAANQHTVTVERVEQIRSNLEKKILPLSELDDHSAEQEETLNGLLDALEVLDQWLAEREPADTGSSNDAITFNAQPLVAEPDDIIELSSDEKQRRFADLLKSTTFKG